MKKLKAFLTGTKVGGAVNTVLRTADNMFLGGAVTNISEARPGSPAGNFNWGRFLRILVCSTIPVILLIGIAKGWWTIEQAKELFKIFG